jgi:TRAP-type C4-dicarboxylate transport system substrate-binding protein
MKTLRLLVLLALAASVPGVGLAQDKPITLRLGHILNETSLYHVSAVRFADALARNSGGRLKVEIFPNGQLGFERDLIEGMHHILALADADRPSALGLR